MYPEAKAAEAADTARIGVIDAAIGVSPKPHVPQEVRHLFW